MAVLCTAWPSHHLRMHAQVLDGQSWGLTLTEAAAPVTGAETKENSWLMAPPGVACACQRFRFALTTCNFLACQRHLRLAAGRACSSWHSLSKSPLNPDQCRGAAHGKAVCSTDHICNASHYPN